MLIPIKVDVPTDRTPWINYAIIAATVLISLMGFGSPELLDEMVGASGTGYGVLSDDLPAPVYALSSTLLHVGYIHLLGNMVFLWLFGNAINYKFGQILYLGLYLFVALVAGMAHYTFQGGPFAGASGAVYGIMGAFLVFFPRNDVTVVYFIWIHPGTGTFSSAGIIALWLLWDVAMLLIGWVGGTAVWAHVGGFAVGFAVAFLFAWMGWIRATQDEQTLLDLLGIPVRTKKSV